MRQKEFENFMEAMAENCIDFIIFRPYFQGAVTLGFDLQVVGEKNDRHVYV